MATISVLIPLYNKEQDIAKTIDSLLKQTFVDFEVIIVNDGSTDGSLDVVRTYKDERVTLYDNQNQGVAKTRNFAVSKATAEVVAFLDADDYWHPTHLAVIAKALVAFPSHQWYATAYEKKHTATFTTSMRSPARDREAGWCGVINNYFENSLVDALAWTSAVAMRVSFFETLLGFDHTITNGAGEDTDLWLRAALKAPLVFCNTITAQHNLIGSNRISHTATLRRDYMPLDKYNKDAEKDVLLKKYLDLNRYSFAIQHKLAGDTASFKKYVSGIDIANLNSKQQFLLHQPGWFLEVTKIVKASLEGLGLRLTSFD
jgi:glycosyltransferase involved in cell wall biosynthesis